MARLNVRCCCQPQKILGTLEVPDLEEGTYQIMYAGPCGVAIEIRKFLTGVAELSADGIVKQSERAVYSDDRPIEFWRKIPGFVEA